MFHDFTQLREEHSIWTILPNSSHRGGTCRGCLPDSEAGLLTIAGGKWTTYRKMALDTIDHAVRQFKLMPTKPTCQTEHLPILGSADYDERGDIELAGTYGLAEDIAKHLLRTYGADRDLRYHPRLSHAFLRDGR